MSPRYPFLIRAAGGILWDTLRSRPRCFRQDAQTWVSHLKPALEVIGRETIPAQGPFLVTVNHYSRSGFQAWWISLAISATLPQDIHWIMTAAWTFNRKPLAKPVVPLTRWLLRRLARGYGFTSMPAMPPDPAEAVDRAAAVRRALGYVRRTANPVVGLAPEGGDAPAGRLSWPPAGAGRFISLLIPECRVILPAGVFESQAGLCLRFGKPYRLTLQPDLPAADRDRQVSQIVMTAIAQLLPAGLRGDFSVAPAEN